MLKIYDDAIAMLELLRSVIITIERRDSDLARQLRRAASSIVCAVLFRLTR